MASEEQIMEIKRQLRETERIYQLKRQERIKTLQEKYPQPTFEQKTKNFLKAFAKHIKNGSPTCTQEEIDARFAICEKCDLFSGKSCTHKDCGCGIKREKKFMNKLYWADQKCPIDKWGPIDK